MANPGVLTVETVLYCPAEPDGRAFPAGSPWPGDAWSDKPGGEAVGSATTTQAMKDLIAAQDQIEALQAQLVNVQHSAAQSDEARSAAEAKVSGLEQAVTEAQGALATSETAARGYMEERDAARSGRQAGATALEAAQAEAAKVPNLVAELETANQAIADLNDKLAAKQPKPANADPAPPAEGGEAPAAT